MKKWLIHRMKYYSAFKTDVGLYLLIWPRIHSTLSGEKKNQVGSHVYKIIIFYQGMSKKIYKGYFGMWGCECCLLFSLLLCSILVLFFLLLIRIVFSWGWAGLALPLFIYSLSTRQFLMINLPPHCCPQPGRKPWTLVPERADRGLMKVL